MSTLYMSYQVMIYNFIYSPLTAVPQTAGVPVAAGVNHQKQLKHQHDLYLDRLES